MGKKFFAMAAMLSALFLAVSCSSEDDKAELKVYNKSNSGYDVITAVYLSENDSDDKTLVFEGSIGAGEFYYIDVGPGSYRVWCVVEKQVLGVPVTCGTYSTGYKHNVELDEGGLTEVDFDGSGIYEI